MLKTIVVGSMQPHYNCTDVQRAGGFLFPHDKDKIKKFCLKRNIRLVFGEQFCTCMKLQTTGHIKQPIPRMNSSRNTRLLTAL